MDDESDTLTWLRRGSDVAPTWLRRGSILIVASYLLGSALLKLSGSSETSSVDHFPLALQFLAVQCEIFIGAWLITGRAPVTAWASALVLFATLALVSLSSAIAGKSDCGCFGNIPVNPWWTTALNITALALLAVARPRLTLRSYAVPVLTAALLASIAGAAALVAIGPTGEVLLARWRGEHLFLTPSVLDVGASPTGTVKLVKVTLNNRSGKSVRVTGGSVTCSCTATQNLPLSIPADGSADIEIELKFTGTPGRFEHKYQLFTDSDGQPKLHGAITGIVSDTVD